MKDLQAIVRWFDPKGRLHTLGTLDITHGRADGSYVAVLRNRGREIELPTLFNHELGKRAYYSLLADAFRALARGAKGPA